MKCCEICGSTKGKIYGENGSYKMNLCRKHYAQMWKHGEITKTIYDPNTFVVNGDIVEISLLNNSGVEVATALVDIDDYPEVSKYKWCLHQRYVSTNIDNNKVLLHRFVTKAEPGKVVDHINHNTYDNRKSNLRICTQTENNMNRKPQLNNKSGTMGVFYYEDINKWMAHITINKTMKNLGKYDTKEEAISVREAAVKKYFGEYAYKECI